MFRTRHGYSYDAWYEWCDAWVHYYIFLLRLVLILHVTAKTVVCKDSERNVRWVNWVNFGYFVERVRCFENWYMHCLMFIILCCSITNLSNGNKSRRENTGRYQSIWMAYVRNKYLKEGFMSYKDPRIRSARGLIWHKSRLLRFLSWGDSPTTRVFLF